MAKTFEEICFDIYKSITPKMVKSVIPIIDYVRKLKNKPPIPLREKLCEMKIPTFDEKVIMLHGVSVGEIQSLEKLIIRIKLDFPDYKLVITTGTVTGQQLAFKKYGELADFITYFPLDVYESCKKFVDTIKPSVVLIAETELWPNFAYVCKEKNIPIYIINGRISDKSYPSYCKIRNFVKLILQNYTGIFCQSELDKDRFILLGSNPKNTLVMKNLKFEIEKKVCDIDLGTQNTKLIVAGSTHTGEEEIILKTYKQLRAKVIDLKLLLAPRHLTRLEEVQGVLKKLGLRYGLRSNGDTFENNNIIILDTLGELAKLYSIADIAYIGGSFAKIGGHNPLEATIYSKPVVSGPSIKNFRDIYSILQKAQAAFVVKDEWELYRTLEKLVLNNTYYDEISANCEKCFKDNQGALEFIIKKLNEIFN
ncbi:MAG: 3-deoxy-D-manno-octulosonic acid transferase [Candidatus Gastranaerophilales bacterium]|nr:3-deoxy-D-manno-octulosonic acid transferase [Candidatus Gastranaerophilales bacterium]